MPKLTALFCCLLLAVSWPEISSSNRLKKTWTSFEIALSLYAGLDAGKTIHEYLNGGSATLTAGDRQTITKLNQLEQDVQATKDAILFKISDQLRSKLSENIKSLFDMAADVDFVHERYLKIFQSMKDRRINEIVDFSKTVTLHEHNLVNGYERLLFKMHETLVDGNDKVESTLFIINRESSHLSVICSQKESPQQLILDLYKLVLYTHLKGLEVRKFAFSFRQEYEHENFAINIDDDLRRSREAAIKTQNAVKSAMEVSPRTLYRCNPTQWVQGENYVQLGPVLQTHIVVSSDLKDDRGTCSTKKEKHTYFSAYSRNLEDSKRCEQGYMRDCEPFGSSFEVCYSDKSSPRLYDWAKTSNDIFGYKNITNCSNKTMEESLGIFRKQLQNHCLCTCDSGRRAEDRYFNTRPIYSDYKNKKVVTGAKLVKIGRVFYIKIQEGEFGPDGTIIGEPEWKEIPEYMTKNHWNTISLDASSTTKEKIPHTDVYKDVVQKYKYNTIFHKNPFLHPITYDTRKVLLDDLSAGENEVITGFRFVPGGSNLTLLIHVTPCDYEQGILHAESSYFKGSTFQGVRQEVVLTEPEVPSATNPRAEIEISGHGHFVRFTSTDNRKDLGQNTVPFLDSQPIVTNPPMPLTGAGLILKRSGYSGGFLALQLKHYNLVDELKN